MAQGKQQLKFETKPRIMIRDNCDTNRRTTTFHGPISIS